MENTMKYCVKSFDFRELSLTNLSEFNLFDNPNLQHSTILYFTIATIAKINHHYPNINCIFAEIK